MIKNIFSLLVLLAFFTMPIFGVEIRLPSDHAGDDVNIAISGQTMNTSIRGNEDTLFEGVNLVNEYLWWSFAVICTALVIYAGFELITANGDAKAMKRAQWTFIGTGVGIVIAMVSYALVKLVTNIL